MSMPFSEYEMMLDATILVANLNRLGPQQRKEVFEILGIDPTQPKAYEQALKKVNEQIANVYTIGVLGVKGGD